ncbi:hypothetical protein AGABI2DRAFT_188071 [Agaricus bisporus var. bisporus H97]|uniref:hypothetical protein n=1 Tax=Agaricus bisporus var. bisporus (strain H97 / ATCC MYA-4626 / FGSC 10389) TaxID=936046 RepID=UPI00029F6B8E|nr:hypothetical protein AGABI2DRAFT_188071 [Agaricus bisporus var. bisporus H97]EKV42989.1 hypothetical protein AGABI2DRAFT_188071 [Agaricus bisporus var. bisporus H97]
MLNSESLPKLDIPAGTDILNAILATALLRCWHILIFFAAWSTLITILNHRGNELVIDSILVTVTGTVLGFVISYRTTSSFERYNEGRRLWSDIIVATRNFARTVWFHVPDHAFSPNIKIDELSEEKKLEVQAKMLVEKKTVINLLGAYAVSVKHYLRGEVGPGFQDLYHSVKFLPPYALPAGMPSPVNDNRTNEPHIHVHNGRRGTSSSLPSPATAKVASPTMYFASQPTHFSIPADDQEDDLFPARMPPKYTLFDFFPFSLFVGRLAENGRFEGRKAARLRAKMMTHNFPLELSLYLSSYIAALQRRKACDDPTLNSLIGSLNDLVNSLTNLERVLTTPIPFSYAFHLWSVTTLYCLALPFMIWKVLGWLTIPASIIVSFIFYGFLVAGEEIENPFGYDKNDLNLDHFTENIIKEELEAVTSIPPPDPSVWAFAPENDYLFTSTDNPIRLPPKEWVKRGPKAIWKALDTREI